MIHCLVFSLWLMLFGLSAFAQAPVYTQVQITGGTGPMTPPPVVNAQSCTVAVPVAPGAAICTFTASNAPTSWAIGAVTPVCINCFALNTVSGNGALSGGSSAASIAAIAYTVTVMASNSGGASAPQAQTVTGTSGVACPIDDGSSGAPSGAAPYPTLLSGYAKTIHELGCQVAGVDYNVGTSGTLTPYTGQTVTGWSYTAGTSPHLDSTADSAMLSNYDFSAINNFQLRVYNNNVTVSNVLLKLITGANCTGGLGTECQEPLKVLGGTGVTVTKSTIDGSCTFQTIGASLFTWSNNTGGQMSYNWFKNAYGQHVDGGAGGTLSALHNLWENTNCAAGPSVHGDWYEGPSSNLALNNWSWQHNTAYQHQGGGTQGWAFEPNTGTVISNLTASYNTAITAGPDGNCVLVIFAMGAIGDYSVSNANFNNNYIDPRNGSGACATASFIRAQVTGSHGANNVNMATGAAMVGSTW
jgi:hypothetical protein